MNGTKLFGISPWLLFLMAVTINIAYGMEESPYLSSASCSVESYSEESQENEIIEKALQIKTKLYLNFSWYEMLDKSWQPLRFGESLSTIQNCLNTKDQGDVYASIIQMIVDANTIITLLQQKNPPAICLAQYDSSVASIVRDLQVYIAWHDNEIRVRINELDDLGMMRLFWCLVKNNREFSHDDPLKRMIKSLASQTWYQKNRQLWYMNAGANIKILALDHKNYVKRCLDCAGILGNNRFYSWVNDLIYNDQSRNE